MKRSIANSIPLGTVDVIGYDARIKDYVLGKIGTVYERFGFEPLYTPIVENAEVFNGHHGEGETLLFKLNDKKGEQLVLKYDSTVPLARVVSMYPDRIKKPYKRYQLQESFRDDEVDKGHFREFVQCDGDIVGAETLLADAEIVMIAYEGLAGIGFDDFTIRLNHRKIIHAIAEKAGVYTREGFLQIQRAIDYADKVIKDGVDGIRKDLKRREVDDRVVDIICELVEMATDDAYETLNNIKSYFEGFNIATEGINDLKKILDYIPENVRKAIKIDFTLARGADYYTGFILEAVINGIKLGAVLGGGRFDNLVEAFSDKKVPAVGMAFGLERIITTMKELKLNEKLHIAPNKILLMDNSAKQKDVVACAAMLREKFDVSILYGIEDYDTAYEYARHCHFKLMVEVKDTNVVKITSLPIKYSVEYSTEVLEAVVGQGYTVV